MDRGHGSAVMAVPASILSLLKPSPETMEDPEETWLRHGFAFY
jgi:hypothetical protein